MSKVSQSACKPGRTKESTLGLSVPSEHDLRDSINAIVMSAELGIILSDKEPLDTKTVNALFKDIRGQCHSLGAAIETLTLKDNHPN